MTVLVVGESLVDVVHDGETVREHPGGSPFNVAIGAARLGLEVELASQIGPDRQGALLQQALRHDGVTLSTAVCVPENTSVARATRRDDGSADYEFDLAWDPQALPDPSAFEAIHIGSLGAFVEPGASLVADLALSADVLGVPLSFDPNVRTAWDADPAAWRRAFDRVAPHARLIKLSDEDAAVLFPAVGVTELAEHLAAHGALVAITQGGGGSLLAHRDRLVPIESPSVTVADTIGAGDSYMAAMLAWCATYDWPTPDELDVTELHDLGDYAARAAAITVSRPGADPPSIEEL